MTVSKKILIIVNRNNLLNRSRVVLDLLFRVSTALDSVSSLFYKGIIKTLKKELGGFLANSWGVRPHVTESKSMCSGVRQTQFESWL